MLDPQMVVAGEPEPSKCMIKYPKWAENVNQNGCMNHSMKCPPKQVEADPAKAEGGAWQERYITWWYCPDIREVIWSKREQPIQRLNSTMSVRSQLPNEELSSIDPQAKQATMLRSKAGKE